MSSSEKPEPTDPRRRRPDKDGGSLDPFTILKHSIKAVPAMKYALAVLGIVAFR